MSYTVILFDYCTENKQSPRRDRRALPLIPFIHQLSVDQRYHRSGRSYSGRVVRFPNVYLLNQACFTSGGFIVIVIDA